jgi:hypothetical protein
MKQPSVETKEMRIKGYVSSAELNQFLKGYENGTLWHKKHCVPFMFEVYGNKQDLKDIVKGIHIKEVIVDIGGLND